MSGPLGPSADGQELSGIAVVFVILGFTLGAGLGYVLGGIAGAFAGALGAATLSVVAYGYQRIQAGARSISSEKGPSIDGLSPSQALGLMSAVVAREGQAAGGAFKSELLTTLEEIRTKAPEAPSWALEQTVSLLEKHPRSPAVHAELARQRLASGDLSSARDSVHQAIGLALDGGANPLAASLFTEFRDHLERDRFDERHRVALARVLRVHGDTAGGDWCDGTAD